MKAKSKKEKVKLPLPNFTQIPVEEVNKQRVSAYKLVVP